MRKRAVKKKVVKKSFPKLYLGRSSTYGYELGTTKKDFNPRGGFTASSFVQGFCDTEFQKYLPTIRLKTGEIKRVRKIYITLQK